ncbi:MAG: hypothetical protein R3E01_30750 [Pirellulaceae bacterium]|nr:hypothetical protein [Planctomycetales bacterium]
MATVHDGSSHEGYLPAAIPPLSANNDQPSNHNGNSKPLTKSSDARKQYHRIATVRQQQGMSLRSVSRQTGVEVRQLRLQEQETEDLKLSDLFLWQAVLDVPLIDLLADPGTGLSQPVLERARLVRIMKTVKAIVERAHDPAISRLAETLESQLIEIMPELAEVGPWHSVGQRRSLDEFGRAAERVLSEDAISHMDWD